MFATQTYDISASVESSVRFHSEIFHSKPKEFIVPQTDHPWEDIQSPGGLIVRIWPPGDRVSAAPAILNMRPRRFVKGVTVCGKVNDTKAMITMVQNQFPCINQQIHWSHYRHNHFFLFRIHQGLWFCYVFLASLTLDFTAQNVLLHHAPS